jgi:hypothetical protein
LSYHKSCPVHREAVNQGWVAKEKSQEERVMKNEEKGGELKMLAGKIFFLKR